MINEKYIVARLNVIDAALECVIKRQSTLARMLADYPNRTNYMVEMSEALDNYIEAIETITEGYEK